MVKLRCDDVAPGMRSADVILTLVDYHGRRHYLQIEHDLLLRQNGETYVAVGFVHKDAETGAVLVELPHEAETGVNRLWTTADRLLDRGDVAPLPGVSIGRSRDRVATSSHSPRQGEAAEAETEQ